MFHVQLLTVMRREVFLTIRIHEALLTSEVLLTSWSLLKPHTFSEPPETRRKMEEFPQRVPHAT